MAIPRRGLRDIRTHSGKVDRVHVPYMAYMKITALEMEKARRGKERDSAGRRVAETDARLQEIEAEKGSLLQALAERDKDCPAGAPSVEPKSKPRGRTVGLKLRY
jgi:hypothetical protein